MKHSIFGYLLGEGFRNVFHNKKSSGASLAIMCATMLIFGLFFMIIENLNNAVETLETQQGIQVFIQKTATDAQMEQIGEQIQAIDGVNKVTFVSKEDALNQTKEKLKDKQALIAGWDESNPFKASYLVTLTDLKLSSQVQDEIKKIDNIDSIQSRDETINGLVAIANGVRIVSAVILTLLVLISIFIIGNTIKLTVHARRKEISIMKYVGATNGFIRWPFMVEGMLIGLISVLISLLILSVIYNAVVAQIQQSLINGMINIPLLTFKELFKTLLIVYLILGLGVGALGSAISMKKYLEV